MRYKKMEMENVPPKPKLLMLQCTFYRVADRSNVKQLSDQVVPREETHRGEYLSLLLSRIQHMTRLMLPFVLGNGMCTLPTLHKMVISTLFMMGIPMVFTLMLSIFFFAPQP
jgi:predicted PurR-regulated permease PerM